MLPNSVSVMELMMISWISTGRRRTHRTPHLSAASGTPAAVSPREGFQVFGDIRLVQVVDLFPQLAILFLIQQLVQIIDGETIGFHEIFLIHMKLPPFSYILQQKNG